jgi:hypothetical protein
VHLTYITESFLGLGDPPQFRAVVIGVKQTFVCLPVFSVEFLNQKKKKRFEKTGPYSIKYTIFYSFVNGIRNEG